MNTETHTSGSTVKNHISLENGFRIQCNTENFVPIVVPGLSSSSSGSCQSTSRTPSRQESHCSTSSSSSSSSPTATSSDNETREKKDLSGIDSHPVPVSSSHVEDVERGDPLWTKPIKIQNHKKGNHDRTGQPVEF